MSPARWLILCLLVSSAHSVDTDAAFTAYQAGRHAEALAQYRALARQGNALAQFNYAMLLKRGEAAGDGADWRIWLDKAARGGNMAAAYALGLAYENGEGMTRSQAEASNWFRQAAEQGHTLAQLSLATQYFLGRGVVQDYRAAAQWYEKAAEGGDMAAQYLIGAMYEHGDGVAADPARALLWYTAAARQGDPVAKLKAQALVRTPPP